VEFFCEFLLWLPEFCFVLFRFEVGFWFGIWSSLSDRVLVDSIVGFVIEMVRSFFDRCSAC
jgi:hypothetical protein